MPAFVRPYAPPIPATDIHDGSVSNAEFGCLNGVTSAIQTQIDGKAATSHGHAISDVTGLQTALDGKSGTSHTHTLSQVTDAGTAAAKNVPSTGVDATSTQVVMGDDSRLTDDRTPISHSHAATDIGSGNVSNVEFGYLDGVTSAIQTQLNGKEASGAVATHATVTSGVHGITAFTATLLDDVDAPAFRATLGLGSISTQSASSVAITGGTVTGITDLAVADGGTGASSASVARTNLGLVIGTDVLAPNGSGASLTSLNASNIASGQVPAARLGSGTASSSTYLRGDLSWASVSASSETGPYLPFGRVSTLMGSSIFPGVSQPNLTLTANRLSFCLSQPQPTYTSLTLQITVITAAAGGKVRVGVYNRATDCGPGTLIGESGEIDCSTTGNKSVTITVTNSTAGIKWLAICSNSSSIVIRGIGKSSSLGRLSAGYAWYDTIYRSYTYAALPSDETSQSTYTPLESDYHEIMWRGV